VPDAVSLAAGLVNFHKLVVLAGTVEGARPLFEQFTTDVVGITHPEVRTITVSPGDWGIDAFVGDLDGGNLGVWQAKFYLDKCDVGHQSDIRESFKSASKSAADHGYTLLTWTLVIPSEMTPQMTQWWDRWKKKTEASHKVAIELWDFGYLRRRMMAPEAREKRDYWFGTPRSGPSRTAGSTCTSRWTAAPARWPVGVSILAGLGALELNAKRSRQAAKGGEQ
jgi:hypothetical protein